MRIAWVYIAVCLIVAHAVAQQTVQTKEVHVAVQVRSETGDPVADLKAHDFAVSASGGMAQKPLELQVSSPIARRPRTTADVPTRLLVVLMTDDRIVRKSLAGKLNDAFLAGWQIRVEDSAGVATPYTTSVSELRAALGLPPAINCSLQCAMRELVHFPGRRVVFLVTDNGAAISPATMRSVLLNGVTVYHVGGDPDKQLFPYGYTFGYSPIINHPMGSLEVQATFTGGGAEYERRRGRETEERSFRSAIQDAANDAKGYYDLKLRVPADVDGLTLRVKVYGIAGAKCFLLAEPYAEGAVPPSLTILTAQ